MWTESSPLIAIAIVTVVVYATRVMGPAIMLGVPVSPKTKRFLDGLSISVIVAIVASTLATSTSREMTAVGVAAAVMFASRSAVGAMSAGALVAAVWSFTEV